MLALDHAPTVRCREGSLDDERQGDDRPRRSLDRQGTGALGIAVEGDRATPRRRVLRVTSKESSGTAKPSPTAFSERFLAGWLGAKGGELGCTGEPPELVETRQPAIDGFEIRLSAGTSSGYPNCRRTSTSGGRLQLISLSFDNSGFPKAIGRQPISPSWGRGDRLRKSPSGKNVEVRPAWLAVRLG
jgi:hypothetical protein